MTERLTKLYLNAGQMKARTTYLYSILKGHPGIYFSPEKEIHYLSQVYGEFRILGDGVRLRKARQMLEIAGRLDRPIEAYRRIVRWSADYLRPPTTPGWYEAMFDGHRPNQWCADFSNLTCTIPAEGLRQVAALADDVRVTYCIRDAVARAISHAKFHLRFAGTEHNLAGLSRQALRELLLSDNIYPQSQSQRHIETLHNVFGSDRLRIVRCETMWAEPRAVADAITGFLDIPPLAGEIAREPVNVGPASGMNADVEGIFAEIFAPLRDQHEALLARYRDIVIG